MVPKYFSRDCSTDSISCSEQKKRKKTRLKQDRKSRKEDQNVVVIANPPGTSLIRCRTAIATMLLCCRSAITLLSHRYRSDVAPPLSLRCRAAVAPLLHRYCSTVAPLMSLLLSLCSRTAITLLLRHCRSAAVAPDVATQSHRYHTAIAPLSRRCRTALAPSQRGYKQFKIELLSLNCHSTVASAKSNTPLRRKTHAPHSHRWSLLP